VNTSSKVAALVLLFSVAGAAFTARKLQSLREGATLKEVMFIRSPKMARYLSLGYTGLAADIYWTRAVQYFGAKHQTRTSQYELLEPLLNLATSLDPHLIVAYEFGAFFLAQDPPQGAGDPDAAVRLVQRGIKENPERWRLYFNLGFIHYIERRDYKAAAEAFEKGAEHPKALPWMRTMAAKMREEAGDLATARYMWTNIYEAATENNMRENARSHLVALKVQEDLQQLKSILSAYRERAGTCATHWQPVAAAGLVPGMPLDPAGEPYQLVPGCRIRVRNPARFPALQKDEAEVQF
jgi:hypothetical protein